MMSGKEAKHKEGCGFRKMKLCGFKAEHCRPKQKGIYCDLYDVDFSRTGIKERMKEIKKELKELNKQVSLKDVKRMKKEKRVIAGYTDIAKEALDLATGYGILQKALTHLKRTGR